MFTIEEKKQIRKEFWQKFKSFSNKQKLKEGKPGKWIMNETGIKQLKLKFDFNEECAWAGIEIDTNKLDKRVDLFDKLEKMNALLTKAVPNKLHWELELPINNTKTVSRIYAIKPDVNIYDRKHWKSVMAFLYETMNPIEEIFLEYFDYIKYQ